MLRPIKWRRWLRGDIEIERSAPRAHRVAHAKLMKRIARAARSRKQVWYVRSGYRSFAEQDRLYKRYLAGEGPLAAKPGHSNHNLGRAADVGDAKNNDVGADAHNRAALARFGLCLPVRGERWHVEIGSTWKA